jgi:hypothetical protein
MQKVHQNIKHTSIFRFRSSSRMMNISSSVGILKGFLCVLCVVAFVGELLFVGDVLLPMSWFP